MKWVASLWRKTRMIASLPAKWIEQRKRPKVQLYHYKHVDEFPDSLETHNDTLLAKTVISGRRRCCARVAAEI